jgi:hypothetical protein
VHGRAHAGHHVTRAGAHANVKVKRHWPCARTFILTTWSNDRPVTMPTHRTASCASCRRSSSACCSSSCKPAAVRHGPAGPRVRSLAASCIRWPFTSVRRNTSPNGGGRYSAVPRTDIMWQWRQGLRCVYQQANQACEASARQVIVMEEAFVCTHDGAAM